MAMPFSTRSKPPLAHSSSINPNPWLSGTQPPPAHSSPSGPLGPKPPLVPSSSSTKMNAKPIPLESKPPLVPSWPSSPMNAKPIPLESKPPFVPSSSSTKMNAKPIPLESKPPLVPSWPSSPMNAKPIPLESKPPFVPSSSSTKMNAKPIPLESKPPFVPSWPSSPMNAKPSPLESKPPLNAPSETKPPLDPSSPSNVKLWPLLDIQPKFLPWTSPLKVPSLIQKSFCTPRTSPYSRKKGPTKMELLKAVVMTTAVILNAYVPLYLPGATKHTNMDFAPPPKYYVTDEDDDDEFPTPWVLVKKTGFASLFDNARRIPVYSKEELTPESLIKGQGVKRKNKFHRELDLGVLFQADKETYHLSGYDQGHLVPAGNLMWGQFAMDESFSFVNIFPQNPKLNQVAWRKIENRVRGFVKSGVNATVFTGTAFIASGGEVRYKVLGEKMVAVPTHVWKAARVKQRDGQEFVWCWLMPNKEPPPNYNINDYFCSVEDIAHATGVRVFRKTRIARLNPY